MANKKYPLTRGKKRISSRNWKTDPTTGARFKAVLPTPAKNLKVNINEDYIEEVSSTPIKILDFKQYLKKVNDNISGAKTKKIINYGLEWLPKAENYSKHVFAIFLNITKIERGALELLQQYDLLHGIYNNFAVISSRTKDFEFYTNVIKFFHSFRSVMINTKHKYQEPIVIRELTGFSANPTFLLFTTIQGRGLLIKSLQNIKFSGGINTELDVLRIGKIIGANVPRNAIVVHNTRSSLYKSFAKDAEILVEDLSPIVASFSWVDKKLLDQLREDDGENLGRLFVFDVITGAWDRHSGNYLVTNLKGFKSLQEIDFGLFKPDFYLSSDFIEEDDYRQKWPSKYPALPGWGIFINSKVFKLMQSTDSRLFQAGIESAIKKLYATMQEIKLENFASDKLVKRIKSLFIAESQTQLLFWNFIHKINNIHNLDSLEELLNRLSAK